MSVKLWKAVLLVVIISLATGYLGLVVGVQIEKQVVMAQLQGKLPATTASSSKVGLGQILVKSRVYSTGNAGVADVELRSNHTATASGSDFHGSFDFNWSEGQDGNVLISNWQGGGDKPVSMVMSANGKGMRVNWDGSYENLFLQ